MNINFPYSSKHCKRGLYFYILKYMYKLFDKYKKQLADNGRMIEEKLGLAEKCLTAHFGRRSVAIALADVGNSMPKLKQAGRWAATLAGEEYMEHSHTSKKEHLTLLDSKKGKQHKKRKKT
eukprot:2321327-Ditylum_brightwellii.AAC.1